MLRRANPFACTSLVELAPHPLGGWSQVHVSSESSFVLKSNHSSLLMTSSSSSTHLYHSSLALSLIALINWLSLTLDKLHESRYGLSSFTVLLLHFKQFRTHSSHSSFVELTREASHLFIILREMHARDHKNFYNIVLKHKDSE